MAVSPSMAAKLVYSYLASLDGFVADPEDRWEWAVPDEEVMGFLNDAESGIGTYLYGRRIYELMTAWETDAALAAGSEGNSDFASMWQRARKLVFSRTLTPEQITTERTELRREFEPATIAALKAEAPHDLAVSGAELAGAAFRAGLVDELQLFVAPMLVGGGKALFPDGVRRPLTLEDEHRFGNGMVYLRYAVDNAALR